MRAILGFGIAVMLASSGPCYARVGGDARWITVDYREQDQVTIPCSSGLICTVSFARGEVLGDYFISDPSRWKLLPTYSQNRLPGSAMGQLVVQAMMPGLRANMVIFTRNSRRVYRLLFVTTKDSRPLYASFVYPSPTRARTAGAPVAIPSSPAPAPTPTPSVRQVAEVACAARTETYTTDSTADRHGKVDPILAAVRPDRICRDFGHTYLVMPPADTAPVDLPIPYEDAAGGLIQTNYHYFANERVFVVDSIADLILRTTSGRRVIEMHVHRNRSHD